MKKTILVTGGTSPLGRSILNIFAKNNYDVIFTYYSNSKLASIIKEELVSKYHIDVSYYHCDISKEEDVIKLMDSISNIDCLVNNASIALDNELDSKDSIEFSKVMNVNLLGTYLMCKYVKKVLKKGSIINISSNNIFMNSYIESIDYDATKMGMVSLSRSFARAYAPNVRVNTIAPGWLETDKLNDMDNEFLAKERDKVLLNSFISCEEVAKVIYFLVNDTSFINDTIIRVDGGIK